MLDEAEAALKQRLANGHDPANIALLTYHGSRESTFANPALRGLAGIPIKRAIGYDAQSNGIYSDGTLLLESVRRFKGQAADAVITTVGAFEAYDGQAKRLLFAVRTQARLRAALITSARARDVLLKVLTSTNPENQFVSSRTQVRTEKTRKFSGSRRDPYMPKKAHKRWWK